MREIKFRAWDKKNKAMFYPQELIQLDRVYVGYFDDSGCPKVNEDIILMQYTGLKDKNGKEIYEKDIIKVKNIASEEEATGFIQFNSRRGYYEIVFDNSPAGIEAFEYYTYSSWEIEVIGNIYENPEFLKKGEQLLRRPRV